MKLPRRRFLHLAASAAALPAVSRMAWAEIYPSRPVRIVVSESRQHSDPAHFGRLLRARGERPRRRAAEQRDELAAPHSITSSANNCIELGTASPSALAVLKLMTSSNLVARSTGRSVGLSPLRIRPV